MRHHPRSLRKSARYLSCLTLHIVLPVLVIINSTSVVHCASQVPSSKTPFWHRHHHPFRRFDHSIEDNINPEEETTDLNTTPPPPPLEEEGNDDVATTSTTNERNGNEVASTRSLILSCLSSILFGPPPPPPTPYYQQDSYYATSTVAPQTSLFSILLRLFLLGLISGAFGDGTNHHRNAYNPPPRQHYMFERLNDRYLRDKIAFQKALWPHSRRRHWKPQRKRTAASSSSTTSSVVIVLDFQTTELSNVQQRDAIDELRDAISFLLTQYRDCRSVVSGNSNPEQQQQRLLEVVVLLESPGGGVQDYGYAASQISRLRDVHGIRVTICVDKIAASGGYMMACRSSPQSLLAAPFAMVGSVGVMGETINVYEALKSHGVNPVVLKAGSKKAPLSVIGEVTNEDVALLQGKLEEIHVAFCDWVMDSRGGVLGGNEDVIGTGDVWIGKDALEIGLVDRVVTSDEYIAERVRDGDCVLKLMKYERMGLFQGNLSLLDLLLLGSTVKTARRWKTVFDGKLSRVLYTLKHSSAMTILELLQSRYHFGDRST